MQYHDATLNHRYHKAYDKVKYTRKTWERGDPHPPCGNGSHHVVRCDEVVVGEVFEAFGGGEHKPRCDPMTGMIGPE